MGEKRKCCLKVVPVPMPYMFHASRLLGNERKHYLLYRAIIAIYFLTWFIVQTSTVKVPLHFIYLTTWGECLLNLYFLSTLVIVAYCQLYPESGEKPDAHLFRFERFVLFLRIWTFDLALSLSLAYWALLRTEWDAFSWHCHLVNSLAVLIDVIISDIPIEMVQCLWSALLAVLYTTHSLLIFHFSNDTDYKVLYENTLDWGNAPEMSVIVCVAVGLVVMPLTHAAQLGVVKLRDRYLARKYHDITQD